MAGTWNPAAVLSREEISAFLAEGYLALRGVVPPRVIRDCQDAVWAELGQRGVRRSGPGSSARQVRAGAARAWNSRGGGGVLNGCWCVCVPRAATTIAVAEYRPAGAAFEPLAEEATAHQP